MKSIRTLRDMFEDQTDIFERVKQIFTMIDWQAVELNGPDIQALLTTLRCDAYGDDDLLDASIEVRGGLDKIIEGLLEIHEREGLARGSQLVVLARAVDFTKAVILAVSTLALEIAEMEPSEEVRLMVEQIRAKAESSPSPKPKVRRLRDQLHLNSTGQVIN